MEIYIVRHGETKWNKEKRLQGSTDILLSDAGRDLAIKTGHALMDTPIDKIYSSPLKRAYETAVLIRNGRDIEIITDERIRELNFGSFEGKSYTELIDNDTAFKYFFNEPQFYEPADDGESLNHLIERAGSFMKEVVEPLEVSCQRIMIVAHGAINKGIMSYIKKHSLEHFWAGGLQKNCNVIILDYTDGAYTILDETKTFY